LASKPDWIREVSPTGSMSIVEYVSIMVKAAYWWGRKLEMSEDFQMVTDVSWRSVHVHMHIRDTIAENTAINDIAPISFIPRILTRKFWAQLYIYIFRTYITYNFDSHPPFTQAQAKGTESMGILIAGRPLRTIQLYFYVWNKLLLRDKAFATFCSGMGIKGLMKGGWVGRCDASSCQSKDAGRVESWLD